MDAVPGSRPVAFRMPCCDSQNTPSPRFYAEIFNRTTPLGNFLQIDSSVFNIITANDPELPRELVLDDAGPGNLSPLPAVQVVRRHGRGLSVSVRDRPQVLGVSLRGAQRLERPARAASPTTRARSRT